MITGTDDKHAERHDGRYPFILVDRDGHDTYIHFLAYAPATMTLDEARAVIDAVYDLVTEDEEWNYDDIKKALTARQFKCLPVTVWEE